jgi:hypothetical protein
VALLIYDAREATKAAIDVPGMRIWVHRRPLSRRSGTDWPRWSSEHGSASGVTVRTAASSASRSPRESPEPLSSQDDGTGSARVWRPPGAFRLLSGVVYDLPWGLSDNGTISGRDAPVGSSARRNRHVGTRRDDRGRTDRLDVARYHGLGDHDLVTRMQARTRSYDEAMVKYGRASGMFDGVRPTIAQFPTP